MTLACLQHLSDEYLLSQGFAIDDPGPGLPRIATRRHLRYELPPACRCCQPHPTDAEEAA